MADMRQSFVIYQGRGKEGGKGVRRGEAGKGEIAIQNTSMKTRHRDSNIYIYKDSHIERDNIKDYWKMLNGVYN